MIALAETFITRGMTDEDYLLPIFKQETTTDAQKSQRTKQVAYEIRRTLRKLTGTAITIKWAKPNILTDLLNGGADIKDVSRFGAHKLVSTTEKYYIAGTSTEKAKEMGAHVNKLVKRDMNKAI